MLLLQGRSEAAPREAAPEKDFHSSLKGTILAGRYQVLGSIDSVDLKAHDLLLDQTLLARPFSLNSQCNRTAWCRRIKQVASVRHSCFLNVVDIVSEKAMDFVLTEGSRGRPLLELPCENGCLPFETLIAILTPLAGALEAVATAFPSREIPISVRYLFAELSCPGPLGQRVSSLHPSSFSVKLDLWQLIKPIHDSDCSRAIRGKAAVKYAVRQSALLTYELLVGKSYDGPNSSGTLKSIGTLEDAAKVVLYAGLARSRCFRNTADFFDKLQLANRPHPSTPRIWNGLTVSRLQPPTIPSDSASVLGHFNHTTAYVTSVLFALLTVAFLTFAILFPERAPNRAPTIEDSTASTAPFFTDWPPTPTFLRPSVNASAPTALPDDAPRPAKSPAAMGSLPDSKITSGDYPEPPSTVDLTAPVPTLLRILEPRRPIPELHSSVKPEHRHTLKSTAGKSVKMRLLALWRQSLVRNQKTTGWNMFSRSSRRATAAYTVARPH